MSDEKTFTQADIDAALAKAAEKHDEDVAGLKRKVEELITSNKQLKRGAEIKPEDLQAAEDRAEKAEAALAEANKALKAVTTERDKAVKTLESEQAFTQKLLIQDGIKSALIANGVKDEDFIDTLSAKFATGATVKVDGDARLALIGDKPVADAIKEWAGSESGKKFVAAPINGGGDAPGGGGQNGGKTITRAAYDADPVAGMQAVKAGATVVDAPAA